MESDYYVIKLDGKYLGANRTLVHNEYEAINFHYRDYQYAKSEAKWFENKFDCKATIVPTDC